MAEEKKSKEDRRPQKRRRSQKPRKKPASRRRRPRRRSDDQARDLEGAGEGEGAREAEGRRPAAKKAEPKEAPARPVVRASARFVRVAPRKARLVADQVRGHGDRGRPRPAALLAPRRRPDIPKLIDSAAANAETNHDLVADELLIKDIHVDEGPTLRRYRPRALGRATQINKRTSHIHVALTPEDEEQAMGQKIHPEGFRVGYIHDWKSNWFNEQGVRGLPQRGPGDPLAHREQALARGPLRDHDQEGLGRDRGRHLHRAPRHRDRQVGQRGGRAAARAPQAHRQAGQGEHQGDQAPRARREARRPVDRGAAPEPRRLPPRDEARAHLRDALRRQGGQGPGLRPARRRRDGADRGLLGRPRAAAHAARRHRLRLHRGPHHDRPDRRQVLDQQGRGHARGLPLRPADEEARPEEVVRPSRRGAASSVPGAPSGGSRRQRRSC